jgi:hypothetical protein
MPNNQPYAFTIYRKSHDAAKDIQQIRWYADTEYGLAATLETVASIVANLQDPTTVSSIAIVRVSNKQ